MVYMVGMNGFVAASFQMCSLDVNMEITAGVG